MSDRIRTLGCDPGGVEDRKTGKKNGVATATFDREGNLQAFDADTLSDARAAYDWLAKNADNAQAIAIDTMLARTFGDRPLDAKLRARYNLGGTVMSAGSLPGAMLVNGVLVAQRFQSRIQLIEVHPKAALRVVQDAKIRERYQDIKQGESEHAADAFLGAWIAGQWLAENWEEDLFEMLPPAPETHFPAGEAVYPWPDAIA